jgi:hypothetical protein
MELHVHWDVQKLEGMKKRLLIYNLCNGELCWGVDFAVVLLVSGTRIRINRPAIDNL